MTAINMNYMISQKSVFIVTIFQHMFINGLLLTYYNTPITIITRHYNNYQMIGFKCFKVDEPLSNLHRGVTQSHIGSRSLYYHPAVQYISVPQAHSTHQAQVYSQKFALFFTLLGTAGIFHFFFLVPSPYVQLNPMSQLERHISSKAPKVLLAYPITQLIFSLSIISIILQKHFIYLFTF